MNKTRTLTEASLLTAIFIVVTMISIGTGIGYGMYLDYIVPIFYLLIYLRCKMKYSLISAVSSVTIILFVLGNVGTAIWASQGIIIGLSCGFFIDRKTSSMNDLMICTAIASIIMVFVDVYASQLIGISFIQEFKTYSAQAMEIMAKYATVPAGYESVYKDMIFYVCISLLPIGTVVVVYVVGLLAGNRLRMLSKEAKDKYIMIRNFRLTGRMLYSSGRMFYSVLLFTVLFGIFKRTGHKIPILYLDVILNCIYYNGIYFMLREGISGIQGFMMISGKSSGTIRMLTIFMLLLLLMAYPVVIPVIIIYFVYIDIAYKLRIRFTERLHEIVEDKNSEIMKTYMKK